MKAFFTLIWDKIKMYVLVGAIILAAIIALGTFVPDARPAITWVFETLRTVIEAIFWLLSTPWRLVS